MASAQRLSTQVLYISYNGMLDPLGQSQVIPYLQELSKLGVRFTLLSYERGLAYNNDGLERCRVLRKELSESGIEWHYLRYHQTPSVPATVLDVALGVRFASRLVRRNKIELVHARAHIPAVIALALKRRFGGKMIFDVRGLMAEEYIDAGHWSAGSVAARLTKSMERRALRNADGVVTLTNALWVVMQNWPGLRGRSVAHETIPCCIDLEKFRFDDRERIRRRAHLKVNDRLVLVYSGSIGGWYMTDEMAGFFATLKRQRPDAFFLWLTTGPAGIVEQSMSKWGIKTADYTVQNIAPREVPSFLSASDAAIAFYQPGVSRLGTSPVKVSEYLACGLPFVINAGIGDSDSLITKERVGALVSDFNEVQYVNAANSVEGFAADQMRTRQRTREVAERLFDLRQIGAQQYARLYENVMAAMNQT
jgi:glycosyltransferase involved in cell wall biosynthesis